MIGHTHYPQNYIHTKYVCQGGKPVYEHVHGGACGAWWSSNLNVDGAPNGYSIYEIKGNVVDNWVAKSTGRPETYQMRVYDGNATYTGQKKYSLHLDGWRYWRRYQDEWQCGIEGLFRRFDLE